MGGRLEQTSTDDPNSSGGVREPFEVQHCRHLLEAVLGLTDENTAGPAEFDLAGRDADCPEFVLQPTVQHVVQFSIWRGPSDEKQRQSGGARRRIRPPGKHERSLRVDVRAEPLLAFQRVDPVFAVDRSRDRLVCAHVAATLLFSEKHCPLHELVVLGRRESIERLPQAAVIEAIEHQRDARGHRDWTVQSGIGVR